MVFFVCDGCNETMKKNQVDKHAMRCADCWAVTCVDCSVSFPGNDYVAHTTCISEAQKYEGSLYKEKKAKLNPQDKWASVLTYALQHMEEAPSSIRSYVPGICECSNVPRQKKKFINFAKNSIRLHSPALLDELWDFLEKMKQRSIEGSAEEPETNLSNNVGTGAEKNSSSAVAEQEKTCQSEEKKTAKGDKEEKKEKKKKEKKEKKKNKDKVINQPEGVGAVGTIDKSSAEIKIAGELSNENGDLKKRKKNKKEKVDTSVVPNGTDLTSEISEKKSKGPDSEKTKKKKKKRVLLESDEDKSNVKKSKA